MKVRVVLVEPEGEINFGFIVRLAKNFEVDEIAVVKPRFEPFESEEVKRFAAQGVDYLDRVKVYDDLDEALKGFKICTSAKVSPRDPLRQYVLPWEIKDYVGDSDELSLIFGRESVGLTREELLKCDLLMHIPASPRYPVLNLSHAVGIALYEVWKQFRLSRDAMPKKPSSEDVRVFEEIFEFLSKRFIKDDVKRSRISRLIRNLVSKSTQSELKALTYLLGKCKRFMEEAE